MNDAERPNGTSWRVLRRRNFAIFSSAAMVSNTGTWMQLIAVPFVMYKMTHSTTWLGIAALAGFLPQVVGSLVGGTYADHHSRKRILFVTQVLLMIAAFALWIVWSQGWATPGIVIAIVFANGFVGGCNVATWQAFVPQLVDRAEIVDAVRINTLQFTGARAIGPALAGLILQLAGASALFFLNAVTYPLVVLALVVIHPRAQQFAQGSASVLVQLRDGIRVARHDATLWLVIITSATVSFFALSLLQLTPAIAKQIFHVSRGAYGFLVAAFGVGAVVGSFVAVTIGDRRARSVVALWALVGMGISVVALAVAPAYAAGVVAMFAMGATYLLLNTPLATALQARVADQYRGRVLAVYLAAVSAGVPLGAFAGGGLASMVPIRAVLFGFGVVVVLFAVAVVVRYDWLRPLDHVLADEEPLDPPALEVVDPLAAGLE